MISVGDRWADVPGLEGHYQINDIGQIKSLYRIAPNGRSVRERILKPAMRGGYIFYPLRVDGRLVAHKAHRTVLEAFVGPAPEDKLLACHKNDIKTDNRLENLYWGDRSQNQKDAIKNGRTVYKRRTHCKRGHELSGDNVSLSFSKGQGMRSCVTCRRDNYNRRILKRGGVPLAFDRCRGECYVGHKMTEENKIPSHVESRVICRTCYLMRYGYAVRPTMSSSEELEL